MLKRILLTLLFAMPVLCQAQLSFQFTNAKAGYQTGPEFLAYEGGEFTVHLTDGSYATSVCAGANPGAGVIPPNPLIPCPLGTNSYIFGYGEAAGLTGHWSLSAAPVGAVFFEINRPDLFQVLSAPPSLMPRPEALPRIDRSLNIGYSYLSPPYVQYRIAEYIHRQTFLPTPNERKRHDQTIKSGSYIFGYPQKLTKEETAAGMEPLIAPIPVDNLAMPESYPGPYESPVDQGFRFVNGIEFLNGRRADGYWNDGMLELDPVFPMTIEWEGLVAGTNVISAYDRMTMWVENTRSTTPLDGPTAANVIYPIPGLGVPYEVPVENMLLGAEVLPPFYFSWTAGDEVVLYLQMVRNSALAAAVKDSSYRVWGLPIRFVTSFAGFAFTSLPPTASDEDRAADADYDLDGYSNLLEYAANTDPNDILSTPPVGFPLLTSSLVAGKITATIPKRPNVGGSLIYDMEWSTDMVNWTTIPKAGDATWDIVEDGTSLTATAKVAGVPAVAFLRAKLTLVH